MKILGIFPIIFSAILGRGSKATITRRDSLFSISPLYIGRDTLIQVKTKDKMEFQIYINNDVVSNKLIMEETISSGGTYVFKYDNSYTRFNNEIYVRYKINSTWTESDHKQMDVASPGYINLYDNESITSQYVVSELNLSWSEKHVKYSFENFDETYITDYYHAIKLSDFKIKLSNSNKSLFSCKPYLILNNESGIFNDIATGKNIQLNLKLKEVSDGFTFELSEPLYVHKETLLLSKERKVGYVQTKHIYLPRNEMRNQAQIKGYFVFEDFGIDGDFVKHSFNFRALKNIIGDCRNSEYCIQREYA